MALMALRYFGGTELKDKKCAAGHGHERHTVPTPVHGLEKSAKKWGGYGPASYWTSDEVHVCGLDVVHEHREVIERRAQQVEQAVHEDVDAHLVRVRVRIRAGVRARAGVRFGSGLGSGQGCGQGSGSG